MMGTAAVNAARKNYCLLCSSSNSDDESGNYTLAGAGLNHSDRRGVQETTTSISMLEAIT